MGKRNLLLDALYPPDLVCPFCGGEALLGADGVCGQCRPSLRLCPPWLAPPYGLDGLTAGLVYDGCAKNALRRFKYKGEAWLAPYLASFIHVPSSWAVDCYVPVPLHPLREWLRTYNQSQLLAQALQTRFPFPIRNRLLSRTRYTPPQARLDASRRAANLNGAFRASPDAAGQSVLLIDDVTTTHSTLLECAWALRAMGAVRVYAACACLTGSGGQERDPSAP